MRLSVSDLEKTVTSTPLNTLCKASTDNADRAIRQFESDTKTGTLSESPLWSDEDGHRLGFLGDHQEIPFVMVHAKPDHLFNAPTDELPRAKARPSPLRLSTHDLDKENVGSPLTDLSSSSLSPVPTPDSIGVQLDQPIDNGETHNSQSRLSIRQLDGTGNDEPNLSTTDPQPPEHDSAVNRPTTATLVIGPANRPYKSDSSPVEHEASGSETSTTPQPQALCLRVLPTTNSFLRTPNKNRVGWDVNDIKIDVYLDGDLCASTYVAERAFHGKRYTWATFSGARNHRLTEIPWILQPPSSTATAQSDGQIELAQAAEDVKSRWTQISDELKLSAEASGRDQSSELSMLGHYLQKLAEVPVPATLSGMLKAEPKHFAVIDVVITTGKGHKDDASGAYLFRPNPLKLHGYGQHKELSPVKGSENRKKQQPAPKHRSERAKKSFADEEIAAQAFLLHHVPRNGVPRNSIGELALPLLSYIDGHADLLQVRAYIKRVAGLVREISQRLSLPPPPLQPVLPSPLLSVF